MAILSHIDAVCPQCGAAYGIIDVHPTYVHRGCSRCRHRTGVPLPALRKKLIYLDQSFFSHAYRGQKQEFVQAAARIKRLLNYQLLVAPYSSVHEDETHQWGERDQLMAFIKAFTQGNEFIWVSEVQRRQVLKALGDWLAGSPAAYRIEQTDVLREDIHRWEGHFRIDLPGYFGDVSRLRHLKQEGLQHLLDNRDAWRQSTFTFEDDLRAEYLQQAKAYLQAFENMALRLEAGDQAALYDSSVAAHMVPEMVGLLDQRGVPVEQLLICCWKFFVSEHFRQVPYNRIAALTGATLKAMIKEGAYQNTDRAKGRLNGYPFDVMHIATYAPYVDAISVDPPMAELLARKEVRLAETYGVKVFSTSTLTDMLAWLDEIEASMTDEHKAALPLAYPGIVMPVSAGASQAQGSAA